MGTPAGRPRSSTNQSLIAAYFASEYRALWKDRWWGMTLARPPRPGLSQRVPWPEPWAIITASNPGSSPRSAAENLDRNRQLRADLAAAEVATAPAWGGATDGSWEEESLLAIRLERQRAVDLARRYGQIATLWGSAGATGMLMTADERWIIRGLSVAILPGCQA